MRASEAPEQLWTDIPNSFCFALKCRHCKSFSVASISFSSQSNVASSLNASSSSDFSAYVSDNVGCSPPLDTNVSEEVPKTVREALVDAYEASRPRAKCMHFRSAIEFALREINIETAPGDALGTILRKAGDSYALPEPLIELCNQVKAFGNWGIHWAETDVEEEDAVAAQKITEAIMLYLFELPALVDQAKKRTDAAKSAHQNPDAS